MSDSSLHGIRSRLSLNPEVTSLPAWQLQDRIGEDVRRNDRMVLTAPPGTGKSTLLPLLLLDEFPQGRILMLEPRRLAARQVAERMASLLGETVGDTIGYRVRFESRVSERTRVEVLTEGVLSRMLTKDPTLDGVAVVIFDEFHERSITLDESLTLSCQIQRLLRPDLRLILMSATMDSMTLSSSLNAFHRHVEGKMYPVDIRFFPEEATKENAAEVTARAILRAHREHEGDILAFLPGERDILLCKSILCDALGGTLLLPLYGSLPFVEQQKAIAPLLDGRRRVVLATSIAETSLTIEGVRIVVDSGLTRRLVYSSENSLSHLETVRISQDMAIQRSGRAGRLTSGVCYRLWSLATDHRMEKDRVPEILDGDLSALMLDLALWGDVDVEHMEWVTEPPKARVRKALEELESLGAVLTGGKLTEHGRRASRYPCHPRIASMLSETTAIKDKALAADLAALLEERDPMPSFESVSIADRVAELRRQRLRGCLDRQWQRIERISSQYRRLLGVDRDDEAPDFYSSGRLLSMAYPQRIARLQKNQVGRFMLACAQMAHLEREDFLSQEEWLSIATMDSQSGRVFLASPLRAEDIPFTGEADRVSWDYREGRLLAQHERRIGALLIESRPLHDVSDEEVLLVISEAIRKDGSSLLSFTEDVERLQIRIELLSSWRPELGLPCVSNQAIMERAMEWLPLYLREGRTAAQIRRIDIAEVIWGLLSYEQQQAVDSLVPSFLVVPSGSRIRLEYRKGADGPVLRARLQECFGLTDTPRVDDGRHPVLMELLSPGFKPVQVTRDLRSFWSETYFEVRKELRRRYPKHAWPENPLDAKAVRK